MKEGKKMNKYLYFAKKYKGKSDANRSWNTWNSPKEIIFQVKNYRDCTLEYLDMAGKNLSRKLNLF